MIQQNPKYITQGDDRKITNDDNGRSQGVQDIF